MHALGTVIVQSLEAHRTAKEAVAGINPKQDIKIEGDGTEERWMRQRYLHCDCSHQDFEQATYSVLRTVVRKVSDELRY